MVQTGSLEQGMTEPQLRMATPAGRWVLFATVLGSSVAALDGSVVNIALPTIGRDLGADVAGLQWIVNGYLLSLGALILLGGSLGDRFGRRRVFVWGVILFAAASVLCGLAPNLPFLIAARVLQGVGGALLTPGSLAIIQATFHSDDRARAIGAWSGLGGVAFALGPFLGGWLVESVSWRWIFLINVPLALAVVVVSLRHVPETADPQASGPIDFAGAALAVLALAGTTFALVEWPTLGWTAPQVVAAGVIGIGASFGFVFREAHIPAPMLPLDIFASRQFSGANMVTFAMYAALGGVGFLLVIQLQQVAGYTPLQAGVATLPTTLLMLFLSSRAGALAQRIGPRVPMTVGPLVTGGGMLLMARIGPGADYVTTVLPAVVVYGLGLSLTVAPLTATVLGAAEARHAGVASAVNNAVARVAALLAVALLPSLAGLTGDALQDPALFNAGFANAVRITAGLAVLGAVVAWFSISDDLELHPEHTLPSHCAMDAPPLRKPVATVAVARAGRSPSGT
jgi:EmrB/QacA subfamily drug resistance transporter